MMLDQLRLAQYRFVLEMTEALELPPFWGSTLRGGFGHSFKRIACRQPGEDCRLCAEYDRCAYGYVFETRPPADSEVLRHHDAVPRPFVFKIPADRPLTYNTGDALEFGLLLVGQGISYLPYFVLAFKTLGDEGIGPDRAPFRLRHVWARDPLGPWETLVYDGDSDALRNQDHSIGMAEIEAAANQLSPDTVALELLTPMRVKVAGAIARELPFQLLIRNIVRRLSSLAYFHCGQRWETDYRALIANAGDGRTAHSDLHWVEWERWSSRQQQRIPMSGLVGEVRYTGAIADYRTLLVIGSVIHVGKNTAFGNGQFRIS
jgi:hypothetical protein